VQRVAWTDERLDDLARRTDVGFDHLRTDIRGLSQEITGLRTEVHSEMSSLRDEMKGDFAAFRTEMNGEFAAFRSEMNGEFAAFRTEVGEEIRELRSMVVRVGGGMIVGFAGVIASVAVGGL
jgi:hypothetical protein